MTTIITYKKNPCVARVEGLVLYNNLETKIISKPKIKMRDKGCVQSTWNYIFINTKIQKYILKFVISNTLHKFMHINHTFQTC